MIETLIELTAAGTTQDFHLIPYYGYSLCNDIATFSGAAELARTSSDSAEVLRQKVTSKGGTTYAAITSMDESNVKALFGKALHAAEQRAAELGAEFGKT